MKNANLPTFVYIDASNIRAACRRSLGFDIDFKRFYLYLCKKYPFLQDVRYYEGIARDDMRKYKYFQNLEKFGYKVCSLARKSYTDPAKYEIFECKRCGTLNTVKVLPRTIKLKSNWMYF